MKAVIMAGGEGARLRPLTCDLPKPMVPIMSRPMMEYIIELLAEHGIRDLAVTLQYLPQKIREHFEGGDEFGVRFTYFLEDEPLGTAGSVKNAESFLDETFLVISGDCLTDINLTEAIDYHRESKALATIILSPQENPLEYGIVVVDEDGHITRFLEKPRWGEVFSDTVNTGIYILEPEVLDYIPPGTSFDFSKNLFPLLMEKKKAMYGKVVRNFWCDVGSVEQYRQVHYDILDGKVKLNLQADNKNGIWISSDAEIHPGARIHSPAFVGKGTRIADGVEVGSYSCLGPENYLAERASIKKGITWSGVHIGKKAAVRGGVLASGVILKDETEVFEGAVVGDESMVENQATIKPGIRIWPCKTIESGATVWDNIIWSGRASRSLFGADGIKCESNVELTMENMVRLGSAFASLQEKGMRIIAGDDGHPCSNLMKSALAVGLQAGGVNVLDSGETVAPAIRMALADSDAVSGFYVFHTGDGDGKNVISFFDSDGLVISQAQQRKIEQVYWRNDFPRSGGREVGQIHPEVNSTENYRRTLLHDIPGESIKKSNFSLFWVNPSPVLFSMLFPVFKQFNCHVTAWYPSDTNGKYQAEKSKTKEETWDGRGHKDTIQAFKKGLYDFGFWLASSGEDIKLFDEKGQVLSDELYRALLTALMLKTENLQRLVLPLSSSRVHEELAGPQRVKILHSKSSPRDFQEKISEVNKNAGKGAFFHPSGFVQIDCIAALISLMAYLAENKMRQLSRAVEDIPGIHLKQKEIFCPWNEKGRVMRRLSQEIPDSALRVEMTDGIKVFHPDGWALVLPDPEKPSYRIYSEGFTEEISESLSDFYADRVRDYRKEQ